MATLTTTATYANGVLLPKVKPDTDPEEVIVTFVLPRARDTSDEIKEARKKALQELEGILDVEKYPQFNDPVAYVRKMRDVELQDDRGYKNLSRTQNDV